ncbi:MATE family efflux transporter [Furfurilactobacillus entadae]|uniref:MATE family efflux transporter n=1 Tax=Furfurilactobacillus entadae TaxID=2922307 RepID=UPI0035ED7445
MGDLTEGKPLKLIFLFTMPLLIGNLFQQLYNISDTVVVGQTLGVDALAAVGSTGSISFLIIGFAQGLTAGLSIVTAQRFGARDAKGVRESFAASIWISIAVTVTLTVLSLAFVHPILYLMQTPTAIYHDAQTFISIIFAGIFASVAFNLLSNMIRGLGDSRTPLYFLIIGTVINVILELVFILVFHMGVAGAGYATVISQMIASVLCMVYIWRHVPLLRITAQDMWAGLGQLWEHFATGLPMGFQMSIIAIGTIVMQAALNSLGTDSVASSTAASKIDQIATMPMSSFGVTMATFAAQNMGAGKYRRIITGVRQTLVLSGGFAIAVGILEVVFGRSLVKLFISNGNEHVLQLSQTYFNVIATSYIFLAVLFIIRNTLQGVGQQAMPTFAGIAELVMRTLTAFFLVGPLGYAGAVSAEPLAWVGSCIVLIPSYMRAIRQLRNLQNMHDQNEQDKAISEATSPAESKS